MKIVPLTGDERERLAALDEYHILDTPCEAGFDDITRMAAEICGTSFSTISLIDTNRQWLKSHHGLVVSEIPRDSFICKHSVNSPDEVLIIPNPSRSNNEQIDTVVTGIPEVIFYAGISLVNPEGYVLGTLNVMDKASKTLNDRQIKSLQTLAQQVMCLLELRKKTIQLNEKQAELKGAYADLEKFSYIASHDLKSPLNNIISLTHLLKEGHSTRLDDEGNEYINFLNEAAYQLSDLVSGILSYSRSSQLLLTNKENIDLGDLIEEVKELLLIPPATTISYQTENKNIYTSRIAVKQILLNLLHNAIKYNDKRLGRIEIIFSDDAQAYIFEVKDNGPGIAEENREKIFELFERLQNKKQTGESLGIGLAIVKRLVEKLSGEIKVYSELSKGTSFVFSIPKQ